jgi:hypothetical protein
MEARLESGRSAVHSFMSLGAPDARAMSEPVIASTERG